jgi:hypothetical protein
MLNWTEHPMLPIPSDEEIVSMSPEDLLWLHETREEAIRNSRQAPYTYGWVFDNWRGVQQSFETNDEILVSGGNRASKTRVGAYFVVKSAVENPNSMIFCFCQTAENSIRDQQSAVWEYLPQEYKTKQMSGTAYISYKLKTGFTDSSLILPNGSQIFFKTYSQYANNPSILEGVELGSFECGFVNLGAWCDEYLGGPEMLETLRFRVATRNAKILLTFTPIYGMTETVRQFVDGAKVVKTRPAELLDNEEIPVILKCKDRNASVHYFWTQDNPWSGYNRIRDALKNESREKILIRAYGVATKSVDTKFPRFNKAVNVISKHKIPTSGVTRYHIIDPAGAKNWFMAWIAVDESGTFYVYREWPDVSYGDWAEWKSGKWQPGAASKGLGFGIKDYANLIRDLESGESIFERLIDPRLGTAKFQGVDGSTSILDDLADQDIIVTPAPGLDIDEGLQALVTKMAWDATRPMDSVNRPHFYVSEECENIIMALGEYTGDDGLKEAWKDAIDVLRYAAIADIEHVGENTMKVTRPGKGGY